MMGLVSRALLGRCKYSTRTIERPLLQNVTRRVVSRDGQLERRSLFRAQGFLDRDGAALGGLHRAFTGLEAAEPNTHVVNAGGQLDAGRRNPAGRVSIDEDFAARGSGFHVSKGHAAARAFG